MRFTHTVEANDMSIVERSMLRRSITGMPLEVVGAVVKMDGVRVLHHFKNVADNPDRRFALRVEDVQTLYALDSAEPGCVEVLWHSHPSGSMMPSQADKAAHPVWVPRMAIVTPTYASVHYYDALG